MVRNGLGLGYISPNGDQRCPKIDRPEMVAMVVAMVMGWWWGGGGGGGGGRKSNENRFFLSEVIRGVQETATPVLSV